MAMAGDFTSQSLLLVMMLAGVGPHSCPPNCKICSVKLTNCDSVSSLQEVLPGLSNSTEAIILLNGGLSVIPPEAFQNFSKLRWLYINGCLVSSLENRTFVTGEGNSLQELDLNNNRLQSCTVDILAFAGLARLEKLILTNNALDALKASWFMDLKFLTKLNMSANIINYIPPRTFQRLTALDHLDLADNRIQYLHTGTFFGLDSLTELNVSRNLILFIDEHTFEPLKTLQVLRLAGNNLVTLTALPELVGYVYLHQNPWECNCKFFYLVVSLKEKIVDVSSVLCDMPANLKGEQVVHIGPDICINATMPPGYLQHERHTSYDPLYSFLGGLLCALIICLIIYFITKRSKQSRTPNPGDQRSNKIHSSPTGAVQENPMKMGATPESTQSYLSSEVKQPLSNVLQTKSFEKSQCHLSWHPSDGVSTNIHAVSLMDSPIIDPAVENPSKRTMEIRKDNSEAIQESDGSDLGGNQFLDTVVNSMSESSARTEGLTKSFTAPNLLFANQEQLRLNPLQIVHALEECTGRLHFKAEDPQSCITQNEKSFTDDPQLCIVQGLKPSRCEPQSSSQKGLQPTLFEPMFYNVQGSESTQEDSKCFSAQHLEPTCDDTNCYSRHVVQPMHDVAKPHITQDLQLTNDNPESFNQPGLQPILDGPKVYSTHGLQPSHDDSKCFSQRNLQLTPHDPKCYVGQGLQPSGEEPTFYTTQDLCSTHNNAKYYNEPDLYPIPKDSKCYIQPDFSSSSAQPKCNNANGLCPTQNNGKYCTQDALSVTVDAESLKMLNCSLTTESHQVAVRLSSAGRLDCLHLPNLLPKTDELHTKRDQDLPSELFQHKNSDQTANVKNMESDCPALPPFTPKHVNEEEPYADGKSNRMIKSQSFVTLPNLHVHPIDARLCGAPDHCSASHSLTSSIPCLITVEPALPRSWPQELSSENLPKYRVNSESRTGEHCEHTAELQHLLLKVPGNPEGGLIEGPVVDKVEMSFSAFKQTQLSRVAFSATNSPEHPNVFHTSSRTVDQKLGNGNSIVSEDDLVYLTTKTSQLMDVSSSVETYHNLSGTQNSTSTLQCWDLNKKSVSSDAWTDQGKNETESSAARQDKNESLCDSNVLLEELNASELCNQKHANIKLNTHIKATHYSMQNTPSISNKSSIKYSCNRIGVVHNQFLDNLCDKYINQSDEMKERICSNNALWKALVLNGFVYNKKGANSDALRKINAGEGNGSRVQETNFDSRCRKPFAFRKGEPWCTQVKDLTESRHSTEVDPYAGETEHAHGSNLSGGCLVNPLRMKNKINLNENSLTRFARKTYHSVFTSPTGIPSCHNENSRNVCPEKSTPEGIQVRESPNSTKKESQSITEEICKSLEDLPPCLKPLYQTSWQKKSGHAFSYQESDGFSPESSEISVLANLHFCKVTGSPALNIPDNCEDSTTGQNVADSLVPLDPVLSHRGPQNIPPTREELLTDHELAVINVLCNVKKSVKHSEELSC